MGKDFNMMSLACLVALAALVAVHAGSSSSSSTGAACSSSADGTCGESTGDLSDKSAHWGMGGELQQDGRAPLTTNFGVVVDDDENSLKANIRGPSLLEDFILREKITHFDHERIPERVVHARGSGARGTFTVTNAAFISKYTKAAFLQKDGDTTDMFVRFSTVAGGAGSVDTPRDVRGFATRFYTSEGNYDLVGNNIPVFFIQDSMKFPDLIHAAKMEPDRGFPQAATAHDNFWDFIGLMPESMHMIQWAMSDRTLPRSLRTMEGFGIHTFRLIAADGTSTFCKFHWKPKLSMQSLIWDEAVKIAGANNDYHRQDLWDAIAAGDFPEWSLGVQIFNQSDADNFGFDHLDSTKLIPEELIPVTIIGKMVLDRNPDNFFQETEQIAFCPGNVVPGIDFSNDPLLQGRLFSYIDTQLLRLGGPNYHQIPVNAPRCPWRNMQRDGHMRLDNPKGRVNYSPNSRDDSDAATAGVKRQGFTGVSRPENGNTIRARSPSFSDHYTQARLFFLSQTETEQNHMVAAFIFELSKVQLPAIRTKIVSHLLHVDEQLAARVASGLSIDMTTVQPAATTTLPKDVTVLSPALSIIANTPNNTIMGRVVGCMVTDGADGSLVDALKSAVEHAGATFQTIAPRVGSINLASGKTLTPDFYVQAGPSVLFDAVALIVSDAGVKKLLTDSAAVGFVSDAFAHLKVIGYSSQATPLLKKAGVDLDTPDAGLVSLNSSSNADSFVSAAEAIRIWLREPSVRTIY